MPKNCVFGAFFGNFTVVVSFDIHKRAVSQMKDNEQLVILYVNKNLPKLKIKELQAVTLKCILTKPVHVF